MSFFNKIEGILLNFSYILHTRSKHWNLWRISKKMRKIGAVCLCVNFNCSSSSPSSLILFGYLWKCRIEMLLFTRISALLDIILMTYLIAFYRIVCVCVCLWSWGYLLDWNTNKLLTLLTQHYRLYYWHWCCSYFTMTRQQSPFHCSLILIQLWQQLLTVVIRTFQMSNRRT